MRPEELTVYLSGLDAAADIVEAIDDESVQRDRGWDLSNWRYEMIPWGVRFVYNAGGPHSEVSVVAASRAAGPRLRVVHSGS